MRVRSRCSASGTEPGHRLSEAARIADLVGDERVDDIELAAGDLDTNVIEVESQDSVVDELHAVEDAAP